MKKTWPFLTVLFLVLAPLGLLAGPVLLPGGASEAEGPVVVRWGVHKVYQPVFIAAERGFFKEAGVKVELVGNFPGGPALIQAAQAGAIDAGHSATPAIINAVLGGAQVIGVADSQTEFPDAPLQQWFVLKDSPIKTAKDLAGRRVGINSLRASFHYTTLLALDAAKVPRTSVTFVPMPMPNLEQALRSGQVDAVGVIDPFSTKVLKGGGVRILFTGSEVLGRNQMTIVFFTKAFVRDHPGTVAKFLTAYRRAVIWMEKNPVEAEAVMARALGMEPGLHGKHRYPDRAGIIMPDVDFWLKAMRANGDLQDGGRLKPEDIATDKL